MKKGATGIDLIMRLMDENARLRSKAVELMTQVQALRRMVYLEEAMFHDSVYKPHIGTAEIRVIFDWPKYRRVEDEDEGQDSN